MRNASLCIEYLIFIRENKAGFVVIRRVLEVRSIISGTADT